MSMSKGKTAANALVFVGLMVGALIALNIAVSRFVLRADWTEGKIYTLSSASKQLVQDLPDRLNIKLFLSESFPENKSSLIARYARDLLAEYEAHSKGKVVFEVIKIKPSGDEKNEKEARDFGVSKKALQVASDNRLAVEEIYLGVGLSYLDKKEAIPILTDVVGLEYRISSLIKQMAFKKKKVAFYEQDTAAAHDPRRNGSPYEGFRNYLGQTGYDVVTVDLKSEIPSDIDSLLILGPRQKFTERAKFLIDQFLMRGKGVALFVNGQTLATPQQGGSMPMMGAGMPQIAQTNDVGLGDLMQFYGFSLQNDLVLDLQQYIGVVQKDGGLMGIKHPAFLLAGPLEEKKHPVLAGLKGMVLPFAGSVQLLPNAKELQPGLVYTELMRSTPQSWRAQSPFVYQPTQPVQPTPENVRGPFALAYAAEGRMRSFYAGKAAVKEDGSQADASSGQSVPGALTVQPEAVGSSRFLLVANAECIEEQYLRLGQSLPLYASAAQFVVGVTDWLSEDMLLTQVRQKGMTSRPLHAVSPAAVLGIKAFSMGGLPVLVGCVGVLLWFIRRSRRKNMTLDRLVTEES